MPRDCPEGNGIDGILSEERGADEYFIRFFGTYDLAWVNDANLVAFDVLHCWLRLMLFRKASINILASVQVIFSKLH